MIVIILFPFRLIGRTTAFDAAYGSSTLSTEAMESSLTAGCRSPKPKVTVRLCVLLPAAAAARNALAPDIAVSYHCGVARGETLF